MKTLFVCLLLPAACLAQDNPLSASNRRAYVQIKAWVLASAEKMPEANYSFKPVETVRSFGQIVGHVADAQYLFCSAVLGEKNPGLKVEQSKTSKADLIGALKDAFAYCDRAYDGAVDATAAETVKLLGSELPKLSVLSFSVTHSAEHYGNLITYMRIKNVVPPSSEAAGK